MLTVITNRHLCCEDFLSHIARLAGKVDAIILREKDLSPTHYYSLALSCQKICANTTTQLILHTHLPFAIQMNLPIQMSYTHFLEQSTQYCSQLSIGVSIHSLTEAIDAQSRGASWLIAGNIFKTNCKPDLSGRGLLFLEQICQNVTIPVDAIGGIEPSKINEILDAGARGVCTMSGAMQCRNITHWVNTYRRAGA